jgi:hypothetical protein
VTLGQKGAMANLAFGYHLNANSEDFAGGLDQDGSDTDITYDAAKGILGPSASFNGISSKISLGSGDLNTPISNGSYSVVCLFKAVAGFTTMVILSRGYVQVSGPLYYGMDIALTANGGMTHYRGIGSSSNNVSSSGNFTFDADTIYLLGVTYNHSSGANVFYIYPIRPGGKSLVIAGATSLINLDVSYHVMYDNGFHLGARLRGISPVYGKGILGEVLIFNDVRNTSWFMMYAQQLRGLLD